jgi:hypothetical protein
MSFGTGSAAQILLPDIAAGSPILVRDRRIVVVGVWAESTALTKAYLQFHNVATIGGVTASRPAEFVLPLLVGGITVLDGGGHIGIEGLAFDTGLVLATSSTARIYTAVAAVAGSWVQLAVK